MKSTDKSERVQYINDNLVSQSKLMKEIAEKLDKDEKAIQVAPNEGQILSTLVQLAKPKFLVEIGTLYGYSACWLLRAMGSDSELHTVEHNKDNYKNSEHFLKQHNEAHKVTCYNSSGLDFLNSWPKDKPIDFLFLDADKGGYLNYLNLALPHLSSGAVVVADNSFLFGHVLSDQPPENYSKNTWMKMRELNKTLSGSTGQFFGMMIPTHQGMTVGVKV